MSGAETITSHQVLSKNMSAVLRARVLGAVPVQTLSNRDDKLVQVVEEPDGQRFIKRSYGQEAIDYIAQTIDWALKMHGMFCTRCLMMQASILFQVCC